MPPELKARALARAKDLGFEHSLSAYVKKLIREDLKVFEAEQGKRKKLSARPIGPNARNSESERNK